jgi:hypothetical protein
MTVARLPHISQVVGVAAFCVAPGAAVLVAATMLVGVVRISASQSKTRAVPDIPENE